MQPLTSLPPMRLFPMNQTWCNAQGVLKPETLTALEMQCPKAIPIVDAWAANSPKMLKKLEADGTLIQRALEAQELRMQVEMQAQQENQTHLSGAEMSEIYGGPSLSL
jgi:hypothetical protein